MASGMTLLKLGRTRSAALIAAGLALSGCDGEKATPPAAVAQAVETITVALEPSARTWSYAGTLKPRYQSDLGFRVGGKVIERRIEVGSAVKKGDVIARLDPTDFELAISSQEAELKAAAISRDEATAALERFKILYKDGHVSKAALDQRDSAAAEARSRLDRAERNLDLAKNQLSYASLTADSDGVVTALPVEAGQVVTTGQLVARIARRDAIDVEVALPEQDVDQARTAKAEVDIWGAAGARMPAALREVTPDADPVSRTFRARFALDNPAAAPELGRTATVHLQAEAAGTVAALPLSAVSNDGTGAVAWVISENGTRARPTPITIAAIEKEKALVSKGLATGDRVVAFGVHMLDPDKPIRAVETRALISQK